MSSIPISPFLRVDSAANSASAIWSAVWRFSSVAIVACAVTYSASSLVGQTSLENSRRAGILAVERTRAANRYAVILQRKVDSLMSMKTIDQWARLHGMKQTYDHATDQRNRAIYVQR